MVKSKIILRGKDPLYFGVLPRKSEKNEKKETSAFDDTPKSTDVNEQTSQPEVKNLVHESDNTKNVSEEKCDSMSTKKFPELLMEIISDENNSSSVVWYPDGQHFEIISRELFLSDVLPRYMKATKWSSFTRKLSRWGFERIKKGRYINSFHHKMFRKDDLTLCREMSCITISSNSKVNEAPKMKYHSLTPSSGSNNAYSNEVQKMLSSLTYEKLAQYINFKRNILPSVHLDTRKDGVSPNTSHLSDVSPYYKMSDDLNMKKTNYIMKSAVNALELSYRMDAAKIFQDQKQGISLDDNQMLSNMLLKYSTIRNFGLLKNRPLQRVSYQARSA